jgi:serine phosphatase RsbU (regulator of sigma subunit)
MSILGSRILNEIVIYEKNTSPAVIFEKLQNQIYKTLHQKDSHNTDGMDLLMCKIDENQKDIFNITFSGAKRALIYFNSETKTIARINGTRKSIGGVISQLNTTNFENIELILPQNSILYLTTDGFIAQHNSLRKRIGSSNLMNIIELNSDKILVNQKQEIETFFKNWKDKQIQTDDVTIWTIKL